MVTRAFGGYRALGDDVRFASSGLDGLAGSLGRAILPALGLHAILGSLGGGLNDATASGRAASSAMYGLQVSMYGLQEAVTRAVLPVVKAITPIVGAVADAITDADEKTDGWSTRLGLAAAAAYLLRNRIGPLASRAPYVAVGTYATAAVYDAVRGGQEAREALTRVPVLGRVVAADLKVAEFIDSLPGIGHAQRFITGQTFGRIPGYDGDRGRTPNPPPAPALAPVPGPFLPAPVPVPLPVPIPPRVPGRTPEGYEPRTQRVPAPQPAPAVPRTTRPQEALPVPAVPRATRPQEAQPVPAVPRATAPVPGTTITHIHINATISANSSEDFLRQLQGALDAGAVRIPNG